MLYKSIEQLKADMSEASAAEASDITEILRAISEKKPDQFLKRLEKKKELSKYYDTYKFLKNKNIEELKLKLDHITELPAIDIIIILHLLASLKKKSNVNWEQPIAIERAKVNLYKDILHLAKKKLLAEIDKWKIDSYLELPSEWAAENRTLPQGVTMRPGKIDHSIAPHMVEICDCAHPDSGVDMVTIMKSTQSLATTTVEHVIGWAIKNKLHNILYIISSTSMAKQRSSAAIDVLIDYSGLSDFVKPISVRSRQRKTGDTTFWKEFDGGYRMLMTSWNSLGGAKSFQWDLIIMDELEEAGTDFKDVGDKESTFTVRGVTARNLKVFKLSTPGLTTGRTAKSFFSGDRRFYFCQCAFCGELQVLEMCIGGIEHGLHFEYERKKAVDQIIEETVGYICKFCKKKIQEYHKQDLLGGGKWRPTAEPVNPHHQSYHISNLMSPIMFYSWPRACQEYLETGFGRHVQKMRAFQINILGLPWENRAERRAWQDLYDVSEDYDVGTVPEGGLILFCGADIQKNSIVAQVVAYGAENTWTVDYIIFHGETYSRKNKVYSDFREFVETKKYTIKYRGKEVDVPITFSAVDVAYNPSEAAPQKRQTVPAHEVYEFVGTCISQYGLRMMACRGDEKIGKTGHEIIREQRIKRASILKRRYDLAVNAIKDDIFNKIDLPEGSIGKIIFTKKLGEEFFRGFVSESLVEKSSGKVVYEKFYERNEPLDTYVLAEAPAEYTGVKKWTIEQWDAYRDEIFS